MRNFQAIEPTFQADQIITLSTETVTTATFADGSMLVVPNNAVSGDYAMPQAGSIAKVMGPVEFESQNKAV